MSYLIIASNRGPISFTKGFLEQIKKALKNGMPPRSPEFGAGGLVQAMAALLRPGKWETTWLGASMGDMDIDVARGHYTGLFKRMKDENYAPYHFPHIEIEPGNRMHFRYREYDFYMRFVFFDTKHMHSYYNKFSNGFLWPLMHLTRSPLFYKKTRTFPRPQFEENDFVQYTSSGVTFANTIVDETCKSRDLRKKDGPIVVWNQDYHLLQVSEVFKALLREEAISKEERKRIHVGQFIHTPFFNIHEIQGLIREDKRKRVREQMHAPFMESIETALQKLTWSMLSNDFIGFQTKEYCDNYLEALEEWFPVEIRISGQFYEIIHYDRVATIGAFPIGLDTDRILSEVREGKKLQYKHQGLDLPGSIQANREKEKYIFGGLERCDYTKGLVERLAIFSHALNNIRVYGKEACLYQITAPSRSDSPAYENLDNILVREIDRVRKKLGKETIVHIGSGINIPQNYRFMKEIDVMLVTPLEDGMNLVAFEYILSQKYKPPEKRGILVLSTSGASRVLKQKGFGEEHGVIYVNLMKPKDAGERIAGALKRNIHISESIINYVEQERRVTDWADRNLEAILNARKKA